jgi:hypothetical protein
MKPGKKRSHKNRRLFCQAGFVALAPQEARRFWSHRREKSKEKTQFHFYSAPLSKIEIAVTNVRALESLRKCKAVKLSF